VLQKFTRPCIPRYILYGRLCSLLEELPLVGFLCIFYPLPPCENLGYRALLAHLSCKGHQVKRVEELGRDGTLGILKNKGRPELLGRLGGNHFV
jgi:hypothetical protein